MEVPASVAPVEVRCPASALALSSVWRSAHVVEVDPLSSTCPAPALVVPAAPALVVSAAPALVVSAAEEPLQSRTVKHTSGPQLPGARTAYRG